MKIHSTAIVDKQAQLGSDIEIGPYAIVEADVKIGDGVKLGAYSYVAGYTEIGAGCRIHAGAVIGDVPQDLAFKNSRTYVKIGERNIIREHVTIHRGTKEESSTVIGNDNFLMAGSHVGHNCNVGNNTIIANGALLAGYVTVEDMAFISGNVVIHQFCTIGKLAIIGGYSGINKDIPPFMAARGPCIVFSVNLVGLRRAKISRESIKEIKEAFNCLYRADMNTSQALEKLEATCSSAEIKYLVNFVKNSKRGISKNRYDGSKKDFSEIEE